MHVRYSEDALQDLHSIKTYLKQEAGGETALRVIREIRRIIREVILENPAIGRKTSFGIKRLHCFPAGKYKNYNIYYTVENNIVIIRVLHGKRDLSKILEK